MSHKMNTTKKSKLKEFFSIDAFAKKFYPTEEVEYFSELSHAVPVFHKIKTRSIHNTNSNVRLSNSVMYVPGF